MITDSINTHGSFLSGLCLGSYGKSRARVWGPACDDSSPNASLLRSKKLAARQIVGKVSPWIEPDARSAPLRRDSEAALRQVHSCHDPGGNESDLSQGRQGVHWMMQLLQCISF